LVALTRNGGAALFGGLSAYAGRAAGVVAEIMNCLV
jgi:hypothetical protein